MARSLPPALKGLEVLATDLRWTWCHGGDRLWQRVDPETWRQTQNPHVILDNLSIERINELIADREFNTQLQERLDERAQYFNRPGWYEERYASNQRMCIAYFSLEFGLGEALPLYAGGLGILAGDHLKAASDLGLPMVGVGLLYSEGAFRQQLDAWGNQHEVSAYNDPGTLPLTQRRGIDDTPMTVSVDLPGRQVRLRVWEAMVGRITLFLLDSNEPRNAPSDRGITRALYPSSDETRLLQQLVLGVGGWRLLRALNLEADVCHLNEAHSAFVILERAHSYRLANDTTLASALWAIRAGTVFTSHTAVASAFDAFSPMLCKRLLGVYAESLQITLDELLAMGRIDADDKQEAFKPVCLALRNAGYVNAVSRRHRVVSQQIFSKYFPQCPVAEVPVQCVTNGVHVPSWDSRWADALWTRACGKARWLNDLTDLEQAIAGTSDAALWDCRNRARRDLVAYVRQRARQQLENQGAEPIVCKRAGAALDPDVLTLGFARRFTDYKRPNLLLSDPTRLATLLSSQTQPVQIVVAGKAHPADYAGKRFVQQWVQFTRRDDMHTRAVFLEDYDLSLAQQIVQGVDVWVNTPRTPWEACGTSGMKVLVNGGLNLSSLDGWWCEAYAPNVGWAVDQSESQATVDDTADAESLYRQLEEHIVPAFYQRDAAGIPSRWVARMRASMSALTPRFSSNRMVREYTETLYQPACALYRHRSANAGALADHLCRWADRLRALWPQIRFGAFETNRDGPTLNFKLVVHLGAIDPASVCVTLYADCADNDPLRAESMTRQGQGAHGEYIYCAHIKSHRRATDFTPRVRPHYPGLNAALELPLITWADAS